jgi:hypothetical protein
VEEKNGRKRSGGKNGEGEAGREEGGEGVRTLYPHLLIQTDATGSM